MENSTSTSTAIGMPVLRPILNKTLHRRFDFLCSGHDGDIALWKPFGHEVVVDADPKSKDAT